MTDTQQRIAERAALEHRLTTRIGRPVREVETLAHILGWRPQDDGKWHKGQHVMTAEQACEQEGW